MPILQGHAYIAPPDRHLHVCERDGVAGLSAVEGYGGQTIVQHPDDVEWPNLSLNALGAVQANYVVPLRTARVLEAAKQVKTGRTYSLGIIVDSKTPVYPPRTCSIGWGIVSTFAGEPHEAPRD
jgi:chemotaxis response regulator CheB